MKKDSGSALVEMAFVAPIFALLLLGLIQYGLVIAAKIAIENAANVAARYAVLDGVSDANEIRTVAKDTLPPTIDASTVNVTPDSSFGLSGGSTADKVVVSYDMPLIVPYIVPGSVDGKLTISAQAIMR